MSRTTIKLSLCAAFLLRATCHAADGSDNTEFGTAPAAPTPDFQSLRVKGLIVALPGPQDTIDPDFAGIRSSLAALGIGYVGYTNNNFYDNMLPAERTTFGQQVYNGQKPTFFTNNVMQMTYDLSRYGISDGQIVVGGIYNYDTWEPAGPNALSLATLSYYQTFLNRQRGIEGWLSGQCRRILGTISGRKFVVQHLRTERTNSGRGWPQRLGLDETGDQCQGQRSDGLYDKFGVQVASNPDGPFAEKTANPTGLEWSTPNSGLLAINEFGYRKEAAPGQLATWVRAASIVNTSRYVDFEFGGRSSGNYSAYVLADRQFVQLAPVQGQAARGWYAGVTAMFAPPEFNRIREYYEARLYGIGLLPSRPGDMVSLVVSRNVFSHYLVDAALQNGQLAHTSNFSITAAYYAPISPGIRVGIGLGYTNNPTPVVYTPQTGSALNLLANVTTYW